MLNKKTDLRKWIGLILKWLKALTGIINEIINWFK